MSRIVVALGGNALGTTPVEQLQLVKTTAVSLVDFIEEGHEIIVTHGNGPQVGMIQVAMEYASQHIDTPPMPFAECGAMSQGYIGYHLQNAIGEELKKRGIKKQVATIITQVEVSLEDQAFKDPTKPVGAFYSEGEAKRLERERGYQMREDAGRGWRRVVPSPKPIDVVEKEVIETLVERGHVVIAVGGGGIPVVRQEGELLGVSAVIDKDYASAKLADHLDADLLCILTAVNKVAINYKKPNESFLSLLTVEEAKRYIEDGQFAKGSMLPKIEAALSFLEEKRDRIAIIANLKEAREALRGKSGTKLMS